jgi:hypothetical protein
MDIIHANWSREKSRIFSKIGRIEAARTRVEQWRKVLSNGIIAWAELTNITSLGSSLWQNESEVENSVFLTPEDRSTATETIRS